MLNGKRIVNWVDARSLKMGFICDVFGIGAMAFHAPELAAPLIFVGAGLIINGCRKLQ